MAGNVATEERKAADEEEAVAAPPPPVDAVCEANNQPDVVAGETDDAGEAGDELSNSNSDETKDEDNGDGDVTG